MTKLPNGWAEATIGEIASYVSRGRSPKYVRHSDLPVINQRCVRWQGIDEQYLKFVDPLTVDRWNDERLVRVGDILWNSTGTGTIGRAAFYSGLRSYERAVVDSHVTIVRTSGGVDSTFLFNFIRSPNVQDIIADMQSGSTNQVELNRSEIIAALVPLPPLREQRRIVAKLDGLTARTARARTDLDRIPALVARYKQRLLALAFSGELTTGWREARRLPPPRAAMLADVVAVPVRNGLSVRGSDQPPGIRALRLSALRGSNVDLSDVRFLPITADQASRYEVREDDVLVSRGNGTRALVGIGARVPQVIETTIFPDTAFRIRLAAERVNPRWFVSIWNSPQVRIQLEDSAKTTAGIWKIAQSDLARVELLLPSLEEQVEIVRRVESAFGWLERMASDQAGASKLLIKLDAAILAKAFRGELVPQDPTDEPAGVLLERIKAELAGRGKQMRVRKPRKSMESADMARRLEEVLSEAADWLPAQEAFRRCGIADGAQTDDVEAVYAELRALDKAGRISVEPVLDPRGRKLHDRLKLRVA